MAGIKTYQIKINGVEESVNAVKSLEKELFNLEERIKALESRTVNVRTTGTAGTGGSSRTSNVSSLSEEEKLEKQILQTEAKREAYSKEIYQNYLASKEALSETVKDQKQLAASERLTANAYGNTMAGMKQELADIKAVMQTVDLGDTGEFDRLTQRANQLNEALKKIEESYGQFGRNVGNYKDSLKGIEVTIAGVTREFGSSREAMRTLREELRSLSAQEKGQTEYAKELRKEYNRLKSAIDDATKSSKFMDEALDAMQSFTALGQISRGFSTFFGLDNSDLERQIAKLVALQNMLQGLEKLNKQIDAEEGIGKWLAKGSEGIDRFVMKLTGAQKRMGLFIGETKEASRTINIFAKALKGIGAVGLAGGAILLVDTLGKLIDKLGEWTTGGFKAGDAAELLKSKLETLANRYDRLDKENTKEFFKKTGDDADYAREKIYILESEISHLLTLMGKFKEFTGKDQLAVFRDFGTGELKPVKGNIDAAQVAFEKLVKSMDKAEAEAKKSILPDFFFKIKEAFVGNGRNLKSLGGELLEDFLARANTLITEVNKEMITTQKVSSGTAASLKALVGEMNEEFATNTVINNVEKFSDRGAYFASQVDFVTQALKRLNDVVNGDNLSPDYLAQLNVDQLTGSAKIKAQNELNRKREIEQANGNIEVIAKINKKYENQLKESLKSVNAAYSAADLDLQNLRLQNMREGLKKQLEQLKIEKNQKIAAIIQDGHLVNQRLAEVYKLYGKTEKEYGKKQLEAIRDWSYEMIGVYDNMFSTIESIRRDAFSTEVATSNQNVSNRQFTDGQLAWGNNFDSEDLNDRMIYYKKVLDIEEDASNRLFEIRKEELNKQLDFDTKEEERRHKRVASAEQTAKVMEGIAKFESENNIFLTPDTADEDWEKFEKTLQSALSKMRGELVDQYNAGKLSFKDYVGFIEAEQLAHNSKMNAIQKEFDSNMVKAENDNLEQRQQARNKYWQNEIAVARIQQDKINKILQPTPVIDDNWGIVNIEKTREAYNKALIMSKETVDKLVDMKAQLKKEFDARKITAEDFFMRDSELDAAIKSAEETTKNIVDKQKSVISDFIQSIDQYIQAAMNSFSTIMNAVWDAQDNANDKEAEALDRANEILEKKLDEQQEIVEQHKSKIDSIEDELQTARGDRRQRLIDQLNAEMRAQREAAAQEKKLQKQKEANERKQDALERKRKEQQYNRDMLQAVVNGAMAVTYALANKWPIPAIPLAALAASTTAAQIAIMAANKPYAKGGLLEGPSHAQGGIPIPGTGIEVEGKEYVIRKSSTAPNIEVLDYINKSQRKLNLDDFIEFYSSGKLKKNIVQMSPRSRFADGGVVPTLRTDIDINDRLIDSFDRYSNRPVVVSVQDINSRQKAVRDVQVLAGLE